MSKGSTIWPGCTRQLSENDLAHPLIGRIKAKFDDLRLPPKHWVAWWGPVGDRAQQVFGHDTEVGARERVVSLPSKRRDRDSATDTEWRETDLKVQALTFGPAQQVRWTSDRAEEWEFCIGSCRCPDVDPSRCMLFNRAKQGRAAPVEAGKARTGCA